MSERADEEEAIIGTFTTPKIPDSFKVIVLTFGVETERRWWLLLQFLYDKVFRWKLPFLEMNPWLGLMHGKLVSIIDKEEKSSRLAVLIIFPI